MVSIFKTIDHTNHLLCFVVDLLLMFRNRAVVFWMMRATGDTFTVVRLISTTRRSVLARHASKCSVRARAVSSLVLHNGQMNPCSLSAELGPSANTKAGSTAIGCACDGSETARVFAPPAGAAETEVEAVLVLVSVFVSMFVSALVPLSSEAALAAAVRLSVT